MIETLGDTGNSHMHRRRWELYCPKCGKHVVLRDKKLHLVLINAAKLFDETGLHELTQVEMNGKACMLRVGRPVLRRRMMPTACPSTVDG